MLLSIAVISGPGGISYLLAPWTDVADYPEDYIAELHRWHEAVISAQVSLLIVGSLLALVLNPRRHPLLAQFILLGTIVFTAALIYPSRPEKVATTTIFAVVFLVAYPNPRALRTMPKWARVSRPLTLLTLICAVPLLVKGWETLQLQYDDVSQHASYNHWIVSSALVVMVLIAGLLTASRRPGLRVLGTLLGATYLYLGVASVSVPDHDGSWGVSGGMMALIAGIAYLVLTFVEHEPNRIPCRDVALTTP